MLSRSNSKVFAVIPARYGSSRFPGKLLTLIQGKSILQWTYENAKRCASLERLVIATDDQRIYDHAVSFGGEVVMTSDRCRNGTERVAEAVRHLKEVRSEDIIINIQGDEPVLAANAIQAVADALKNSDASMSTAIAMLDPSDAEDPSVVKCVIDNHGYALYFSRASIPGYQHIGIYGFLCDFLFTYPNLPLTPLQEKEQLEQLKALEHGYKIKTVLVPGVSIGVNTIDDIKKVEQYICQQNISSSQEASVPPSEKD